MSSFFLGGAAIVGIYTLGFPSLVNTNLATTTTTTTAAAAAAPTNKGLSASTSLHKSGKFFDEVNAKLKEDGASMVKKINAVIGFQVACANNQTISYVIDMKNASGCVYVNDGSNMYFHFFSIHFLLL